MNAVNEFIAVSAEEHALFGCPHCGYRSGYSRISYGNTVCWDCAECGNPCAVLTNGATKSDVGFGEGAFQPELQRHPRFGTPSHGKSDECPTGGGEFFNSRGVGLDTTPGCFVCGGESGIHHNISAFVRTKAAGERVVAMFSSGAKLDYREHSPDRVQVKIGSCSGHLPNLVQFIGLTSEGIINEAMVQTAKDYKQVDSTAN